MRIYVIAEAGVSYNAAIIAKDFGFEVYGWLPHNGENELGPVDLDIPRAPFDGGGVRDIKKAISLCLRDSSYYLPLFDSDDYYQGLITQLNKEFNTPTVDKLVDQVFIHGDRESLVQDTYNKVLALFNDYSHRNNTDS